MWASINISFMGSCSTKTEFSLHTYVFASYGISRVSLAPYFWREMWKKQIPSPFFENARAYANFTILFPFWLHGRWMRSRKQNVGGRGAAILFLLDFVTLLLLSSLTSPHTYVYFKRAKKRRDLNNEKWDRTCCPVLEDASTREDS